MRRSEARKTARAALATAGLAAVAVLLVFLAGCFSPSKPPCAFSCLEPPHLCPDGYECGEDRICHRVGATGECDLSVDAGEAEAGEDDAVAAASE